MASSSYHNLIILSLIILVFHLIPHSFAATSFRPKALLLAVSKDQTSLQYTTKPTQRTPPVSVPLVLHLGGQFLWVDCDQSYVSSSYRPARCNSSQCALANSASCGTCNSPPRPGCNNNTCGLIPDNPFINTATSGELASDTIRVSSTDGSSPGPIVTVPNFLFTCGSTFLLKGLANKAQGIAGLGRTKISLPSQFSSTFNFPKKFAICLSRSNGVAFFGDGPYRFLPRNNDVSSSLTFTPLIKNPVSTAAAFLAGEPSSDYFIKVNAIKVNGKEVPLNKTLLSIDSQGKGGTKFSTVNPYTVMQTSVFNAVTKLFINEVGDVARVKAVAPFKVCYDLKSFSSTRVGPGVPTIDLVLKSEEEIMVWRIWGANSMVAVSDEVVCLGFVDGGDDPRTSVVIGGHQLEDNLLQFDLAKGRVGFSGSLLFGQTTCANFNFTATG